MGIQKTNFKMGEEPAAQAVFTDIWDSISEGDLVGQIEGKLLAMTADPDFIAATAKSATTAEKLLSVTDSYPRAILEGVLPDGTEIRKTSSDVDNSPYGVGANADILAIRDGKLVGHITSEQIDAYSDISCIACHPTENRVFILRYKYNASRSYCNFDVQEYDSDLNLVATSDEVDQGNTNCLPNDDKCWGTVCTADGWLCIPFKNSDSDHRMIIYNVDTGTLKRSGSSNINGSKNSNATNLQGQYMSFAFLDDEKTTLAYSYWNYSASGNYYIYTHIIKPSEADPFLTSSPIDHSRSSPYSTAWANACDRLATTRDRQVRKIIQAESNTNIIAVPAHDSSHESWKIYDISTPSSPSLIGTISVTANSYYGTITFSVGDLIYCIGHYTTSPGTIRYSIMNMITGESLANNVTLVDGYTSNFYIQNIFYESGKLFVPYWTNDNTTTNSGIVMRVYTLGESSISFTDVSLGGAGTDSGDIKDIADYGRYILVLQGGYSASGIHTDLRYHLFEKSTESWYEEASTTELLLADLEDSQSYDLLEKKWPWAPFLIPGSHEVCGVLAHGMETMSNTAIDHLKINFDNAVFVGVAAADSDDNGVAVQVSGMASVSQAYHSLFKKIDSRDDGGNAALIWGPLASLKGEL